jgi:hypothetical protein
MPIRTSIQNFMRTCAVVASLFLGGCAVYSPAPGPVYVRPAPVYVAPAPYYGPYYGPYYRHTYPHHYRRY